VVPVEVSISEPIGADADVAVGDRSLRVSTPDGIVTEKLRAFPSIKGRSATGTGPKTSRTWRTSYVGAPLSISTKSPGSCWRRPKPGSYGYDDLTQHLLDLVGNFDIPEHDTEALYIHNTLG